MLLPVLYTTAALAALASAGDTVSSGGLTGISLWGFLGGANASSPLSPIYGDITTSTPAGLNGKNSILRYYLLGAGAGKNSVVSLGEIDPNFGGTAASPAFVAFENTGGSLLTQPELIVPGGAGRNISNLSSLHLLAAPATSGAGGVTTSFQLTGNTNNAGTYTKADLQGDFTPVTSTISGDTYTGVPLWTLLDPTGSATGQIVVTQGSDGYEVVLSLAEIDPALGGNPDDLLPYADTGADFPTDGVARTIFPDDNRHGRWESNLRLIDVLPVPEPGSFALFGFAVPCLGALRSLLRRTPTAARRRRST